MPGIKHDQHKVRMDLLPPDALWAVAEVLTFGAGKYGDRNWEQGMEHGRLLAALERHKNAHERGEDYDEETKLLHLAHAACCSLMVLALFLRGDGTDDRSPHARMKSALEAAADEFSQLSAKKMLEQIYEEDKK